MYASMQFHDDPVKVSRNSSNSGLVRLQLGGDDATVVMPEHMWQQVVDQLAALGITANTPAVVSA